MSLRTRIRNLFGRRRLAWQRVTKRDVVRRQTMFGLAKVYERSFEHERVRVLELDGSLQSATYMDERWCEPPFPYLREFGCVYEVGRPMRDLCMLGGGGYAFPKYVVAHHPESLMDVVEIDPSITELAREFFYLDRLQETYQTHETGCLSLVCDDALQYLRSCAEVGRRYDAILNDCFAAGDPETGFATPDGATLVAQCLAPGGLYLSNVISALEGEGAEPLMHLVSVLSAEFNQVLALPCGREDHVATNNVVVVAALQPVELPRAIRLFESM